MNEKTISEIAKMSGVSVRTLHYYDEIGLLKPSEIISETGYRYYDATSMERLQQILFYRELGFPLKEIGKMIHASEYQKEDAFLKQKELLMLKRKRIDKLIKLLDANMRGDTTMSFKEFDRNEIEEAKEKYVTEVIQKWGKTNAYEQHQKKTASYSNEDWKNILAGMDTLLEKFAAQVGKNPNCEEVQRLVSEWQQYITESYYNCTKEILSSLGSMYVMDERFTKNIDKFKRGTAKLMSDAIAIYCE